MSGFTTTCSRTPTLETEVDGCDCCGTTVTIVVECVPCRYHRDLGTSTSLDAVTAAFAGHSPRPGPD